MAELFCVCLAFKLGRCGSIWLHVQAYKVTWCCRYCSDCWWLSYNGRINLHIKSDWISSANVNHRHTFWTLSPASCQSSLARSRLQVSEVSGVQRKTVEVQGEFVLSPPLDQWKCWLGPSLDQWKCWMGPPPDQWKYWLGPPLGQCMYLQDQVMWRAHSSLLSLACCWMSHSTHSRDFKIWCLPGNYARLQKTGFKGVCLCFAWVLPEIQSDLTLGKTATIWLQHPQHDVSYACICSHRPHSLIGCQPDVSNKGLFDRRVWYFLIICWWFADVLL